MPENNSTWHDCCYAVYSKDGTFIALNTWPDSCEHFNTFKPSLFLHYSSADPPLLPLVLILDERKLDLVRSKPSATPADSLLDLGSRLNANIF
jgi:hypothetical protein